MGIGMFVLGGAMQGIGQGMAREQEVGDQLRRDEALMRLRGDDIRLESDLEGERQAQTDHRRHSQNKELRAMDQKHSAEMGKAGVLAEERKAQRDRGWQVENREDKQSFDSTKAQAERIWAIEDREDEQQFKERQSRIDNAARHSQAIAEIKARAEVDGRQVHDVVSDFAGKATVIYKDGRQRSVDLSTGFSPNSGEQRTQGVDYVWDADKSKLVPNRSKGAKEKIATRNQLIEMAQRSGKSVEEAEEWARNDGWTIR